MEEIVIPKNILAGALFAVLLVVAALWFGPQLLNELRSYSMPQMQAGLQESAPSESEDLAASQAALAGARAFYTLDTADGMQAWLDRLCSVSTQTGCVVYQNVILPNLWERMSGTSTKTTVDVSPVEKVQDAVAGARGDAPMQVWRLDVRLSAPWPVQAEPLTEFPALALVVKEAGAWKFERFLSEDEFQFLAAQGE